MVAQCRREFDAQIGYLARMRKEFENEIAFIRSPPAVLKRQTKKKAPDLFIDDDQSLFDFF